MSQELTSRRKLKNMWLCSYFVVSGRQDLNLRPPAPQPESGGSRGCSAPVFTGVWCLGVLASCLHIGPQIGPQALGWEALVDHRDLVLVGGVVHVDLGRLDVGVAEPLLQLAKWHALGGHARGEQIGRASCRERVEIEVV